MAKETKTINVKPANEESTIELYQNFGWELSTTQEILNTDSHLEQKLDGVYSVTTKQHYIRLVFSRDTTMPNYQKLVELENEFYKIKVPNRMSFWTWIWILATGICVSISFFQTGEVLPGIIALVLGIGLGILSFAVIQKNHEKYRAATHKKLEILKEAESLLED